jgi:hypothetical protein
VSGCFFSLSGYVTIRNMKKRKEVQMMVKRIIVLLTALLALCSMAFALPAGIDNSANLVQIAGWDLINWKVPVWQN